MRVAVNSHALPVYKENRIASLLCIFENTITFLFISRRGSAISSAKQGKSDSIYNRAYPAVLFTQVSDTTHSCKGYKKSGNLIVFL